MFTFLLVLQALIAATLVGVILMQQSEGGGLGMGGSPTGLMSARGAANFLTRATGILAVTFVGLSIAMAVLATQKTSATTIDTSLARKPVPVAPPPVVPLAGDPSAPQSPPLVEAAPGPVVPMASSSPVTKPVPSKPDVTSANRTAPAPKVTPTLPAPVASNMPTPAPTADDAKGN